MQVPSIYVHSNMSIVHLEMINVLIAIRCWKKYFTNKTIRIFCDNAAVVTALNNYRIRDPLLLTCARNVWLELADANINLKVQHIEGKSNVYADILSRWFSREKFSQHSIGFLKYQCDWFDIDNSCFFLNHSI